MYKIFCYLLVLLVYLGVQSCNKKTDCLYESLKKTPEDTKPGVYWHWLNSNISKEGITKDL